MSELKNIQLEKTADGYVKFTADNVDELDITMISAMNTNHFILPSFRDRYEENSVLYHIGEYISLASFLASQNLNFNGLQTVILQCIESFLAIQAAGLNSSNILPDLDYVFINQNTGEIRVVLCPMKTSMNVVNFAQMMKKICYSAKTAGASDLLGILLEETQHENIDLIAFKEKIAKADQKDNVRPQRIAEQKPKVVQTPPQIVERVVEKKASVIPFAIISVVVYAIAALLVPTIKGYLDFDQFVSLGAYYYISFTIATIVVLVAAVIMSSKNDNAHNEVKPMPSQVQENRNEAKVVRSSDASYQRRQQSSNQLNKEKQSGQQVRPHQGMQPQGMNPQGMNPQGMNSSQNVQKMPQQEQSQNKSQTVQRMGYIPKQEANNDDLEATAVLSGDTDRVTAYLIEKGKSSILDRIFIEKDVFVIGRDGNCDFKVNDGTVSKQHAKIEHLQDGFYITDLGSSNCTYLNGKELTANKPERLMNEATLKFGNKEYVFSEEI